MSYSSILRLSFILIFSFSLFYLYPKQIVYGEQVCVGEVTWEGGYVAPAGPDICSLDSINKSTCTDSNYWNITGQKCCEKRFPQLGTTCQGSITNFDQIGSSYIWHYKCCYEVTPTPPPTPTPTPPPTPTPTDII